MVLVPCTVLGGLPVIADVWFSRGDGYTSDDDAGVDVIYWQSKTSAHGNEFSKQMYARLEKSDPYWQADVTEQASEYLAHRDDEPEERFTLT